MTPAPVLRLGVDIGPGSTHTALLEGAAVLSVATSHTSHDLADGLRRSIDTALTQAAVPPERIGSISVGTAFASSALAQTAGLRRVAAVRIGASMTRAVRPFFDWPSEVAERVDGGSCIVGGGVDVGGNETAALDESALRGFLRTLAAREVGVAITSTFSAVDPRHELRALEIVHQELGPGARATLSHEVGGAGLVERENATILNSSLTGPMDLFTARLRRLLSELGLQRAALNFSCNDGSVISLEYARQLPVSTVASETASAFRGAAVLAGVSDAVILNTRQGELSIGAMLNGRFPEAAPGTRISGVAVRLRRPDAAHFADWRSRDRAAADSLAAPGDGFVGGASQALSPSVLAALHEAAAYAGSGGASVPLVIVGDSTPEIPIPVPGISETILPQHAAAAAAVGAAIAEVHGAAEGIAGSNGSERQRMEQQLRRRAIRNAVRAGADPHRTEVVEFTAAPLSYLDEPLSRFSARTAGPVRIG